MVHPDGISTNTADHELDDNRDPGDETDARDSE